MFSPERSSKVAKFAKNDRFDALIVLAKDEPFFYFSLENDPKGGPLDDFLFNFVMHKNLQFC